MRPWLRYTLLQVPGLILLGALLYAGWNRGWLGGDLAVLVMLLWLLKDVLLYPLYRPALQAPGASGGAALIGCEGLARSDLAPEGFILIRGERWQARSHDGSVISQGTPVRVVAANGLRLQVVRHNPPQQSQGNTEGG